MFLAFVSASFAQQITTTQNWKESDFYKKSKKQKIAAWIFTGVGTIGLIATLTDYDQSTGDPYIKNVEEYQSIAILSSLSLLSGIYLFIASSKNKKKAKAASVFIDFENVPTLHGTVLNFHSFPSMGVKIHL